ncbi:hypothetical protein [Thiorhodovibrio winogradskyi]|uniref:hypothetical protein n=1 Tax=Thiorhodovibrio winogradskyi TaxID=77007 RepID=UPI002E299B2B|nr:hypothetical protein [Thiorhodovibrio winogradskyi]
MHINSQPAVPDGCSDPLRIDPLGHQTSATKDSFRTEAVIQFPENNARNWRTFARGLRQPLPTLKILSGIAQDQAHQQRVAFLRHPLVVSEKTS